MDENMSEILAALAEEAETQESTPPAQSPVEAAMMVAELGDTLRAAVEAQRLKIVEDGYPESVSYRMAADMWSGVWRGIGSGS